MFKKLKKWWVYKTTKKVSHTFELNNDRIKDGINTIGMAFDVCDFMQKYAGKSNCPGSYVRVSNKPSSDDTLVMTLTSRTNNTLRFTVDNTKQYSFCKSEFIKYFLWDTEKLFIKHLS